MPPFHLAPSTFPYLGINISDTVPSLFKYHIMELVEEIRLDFQPWDTLPHSLVGRINSVKRIFYPTFYFYSSMLTNIPPSIYLEIAGDFRGIYPGQNIPSCKKQKQMAAVHNIIF